MTNNQLMNGSKSYNQKIYDCSFCLKQIKGTKRDITEHIQEEIVEKVKSEPGIKYKWFLDNHNFNRNQLDYLLTKLSNKIVKMPFPGDTRIVILYHCETGVNCINWEIRTKPHKEIPIKTFDSCKECGLTFESLSHICITNFV